MLDPVDGTKGFLRGQQYAVALALLVDGHPQVAVMACPNLPAFGDDIDTLIGLLEDRPRLVDAAPYALTACSRACRCDGPLH